MPSKQVRLGQVIAPFGPGSIYTDRRGTPHVVCGLDHWFKRWDQTRGLLPCQDQSEFQRFEPRLAELLNVGRFCSPPDFRVAKQGQPSPPNAQLYLPAQRFPRWYRNTKTGEMRRFNLSTQRLEAAPGGGRWKPVRFIAVCAGGIFANFPGNRDRLSVHGRRGSNILTDRGGSELTSVRIECTTCPPGSSGRKGKSLAGTTTQPNEDLGEQSSFTAAGISCPGDRPWLGENAGEPCNRQLVGALINQTNIYFPRTISAILLPDLNEKDPTISQIRNEIEQDPGTCGVARTLWNMNDRSGAVALVQNSLMRRKISREVGLVEHALETLLIPSSAMNSSGPHLRRRNRRWSPSEDPVQRAP
jgi:hypothetical protein